MSSLRFETLEMPAAQLGGENPLPDLVPFDRETREIVSDVPEEDGLHVGYGRVRGILPYGIQDRYDRDKKPRKLRVAVLENDRLKAVFLLDYGGRLWSLLHKPANRELLYRNPVFQPANLALRNAWFSGGVEWNIGMVGHTPFTCSPLHAERLEDGDGTPVLRLYEWERIRQATYQMDFYLPERSDFLFARMRITNNLNQTVPMYWWSNIAVPEGPDSRVIVPAEEAYHHGYDGHLRKIGIPVVDGRDVSYPVNSGKAVDFFFHIPKGGRRWIASADQTGEGLVQTSTALLKGRKLFVWGMNAGGRHWQEYLSVPGKPYIEIQAGLAHTQMECLPMPAGAVWEWLEAYGPVRADPAKAHGAWGEAARCVAEALQKSLPKEWLDAELLRTSNSIAGKAGELVSQGSGWAALENLRRKHAGQEALAGLKGFGEGCVGEEQRPWARLLREGEFPWAPPLSRPGAWMIQQEWKDLLERAVNEGRGNHWLSWLHIGVMRYAGGDYAGAEDAWRRSIELEPSPWAYRNLAVCAASKKDHAAAAGLMLQAREMLPGEISLLRELFAALLRAGRAGDAIELYDRLAEETKNNGRVRLYCVQALLDAGRLEECGRAFGEPFEVFDIREGEASITDLWFRLQAELIAKARNAAVDDGIRKEAGSLVPPFWMDYR